MKDLEKKHFQGEMERNKMAILEENAIIRGTKLERLKHSPMVKAKKEADRILDDASKEMIGMIMEEAKDIVINSNLLDNYGKLHLIKYKKYGGKYVFIYKNSLSLG